MTQVRGSRGVRRVNPLTVTRERAGDESGMVTAELALAIPILVGFTAVLSAVLMWAGLALTTHDVAHHAVRAAARGVSEDEVRAYVHTAIPDASVTVASESDRIAITVTRPIAYSWFPEWQMAVTRTAFREVQSWDL